MKKEEQEYDDSSTDSETDGIDDDVDDGIPKSVKEKWTNRERVLIFCSRGASYRDRHLMNDFKAMMPHSKEESKIDKSQKLAYINEICEMKNCNKCIYFESRKRKDLYMWVANVDKGPSAKFLVQNVHTTGELKLSGNCLKGSRPILSFDKTFDEQPHFQLVKELFCQTFSTPNHHPKSQPFVDHVFNFSIESNRIWFRNYQIIDEETKKLEEIGPRIVLHLIKIFEGSFGGAVIYENPDYICPNTVRREKKSENANRYVERVQAKADLTNRRENEKETFRVDKIEEEVFDTTVPESATEPSTTDVHKIKRYIESSKRRNMKGNKKRKTISY